MDNKHRAILRRNEWYLSKDLEPTKLLPLLHEVLDTTDVQNIKALAVQEDKSKALLDMLQRRGPDAFEVFVKALQTVQPFLAKFLIEQSGEIEKHLLDITNGSQRDTRYPGETFLGGLKPYGYEYAVKK